MSNLKMAREVLKDATKSNLPASTEVFLNKWAPKLIDELEHLEQAADRMAKAAENIQEHCQEHSPLYETIRTKFIVDLGMAREAYQSLRAKGNTDEAK